MLLDSKIDSFLTHNISFILERFKNDIDIPTSYINKIKLKIDKDAII